MSSIRQAIEENTAARAELTEAIRAVDFNGHTPDDLPASDYDRGWQAGYNQAILNMCYQLATSARAELAEVNALLERAAARPAA